MRKENSIEKINRKRVKKTKEGYERRKGGTSVKGGAGSEENSKNKTLTREI